MSFRAPPRNLSNKDQKRSELIAVDVVNQHLALSSTVCAHCTHTRFLGGARNDDVERRNDDVDRRNGELVDEVQTKMFCLRA